MTVNKCSILHVDQCVEVHMRSFEGFFLTFLGRDFLKLLYKSIIEDPSGIGYVFLENEKVFGFVFGSSQPAGLYKRLIQKRLWQFSLASISPIMKQPKVLIRLMRAFRLTKQENNIPDQGTLMSIAIDPLFQGKRIGKELVIKFLTEAKDRGCHSIDLTTDAVDNDSVNEFYKRMGFSITRTFITPEGRKMNEYRIMLDSYF